MGHGSTKGTKSKRGHGGLGFKAGIAGKITLRYLLSLRFLRGIVPLSVSTLNTTILTSHNLTIKG
jgi:hypothetical protein